MLVYGLRLLVALITFGIGAAASWLLGSEVSARHERRVETTEQVFVFRSRDEFPPPPETMRGLHCKDGLFSRGDGAGADVVEGGILNRKANSLPAAVYPPAAKAAGIEGTVYVRVTVDESGRVDSARAFGGPQMLRQAAVDAAREAVFAPTRLSGRPVRVSGIITYNFGLE